MKKTLAATSMILAAITVALSGCGGLRKAEELGVPREAERLTNSEITEIDSTLRACERTFAAKFTEKTIGGTEENVAISPLSVFLSLGLAAECARGETQEELLSVLGTDHATLKGNFADLCRSVIAEHDTNMGSNVCRVELGNSIWLQREVPFKSDLIQTLSNDYLCYSYAADFRGDNRGANGAVRAFVKDQTRGLIDREFALSEETLFTIVNTLYFKDLWNMYGDNLPYAEGEYTFTKGNGERTDVRLLQGYFFLGRTYETETFTHFFTETDWGYKLSFVLPKEGHTVGEVFTADAIDEISALTEYSALDDEKMLEYHTRCLFPTYVAEFDGDVKEILREFGVEKLFSEDCDLTALTDEKLFCEEMRHVARIDVNRRGIEGSSVTVIPGAGAAGPGDYTPVYEDFVVDRAFGFLLTDPFGTVLFSGVTNLPS